MEFIEMSIKELKMQEIRENLIDIQLALTSQHNTVTTDMLDAQEDKTHWRINNAEQIKKVEDIAASLGISLCSSPRYKDGNNSL